MNFLPKLPKQFFLVGTDTGIGKTFFAKEVIKQYVNIYPSNQIAYVKPFQTGISKEKEAENREKSDLETVKDYSKSNHLFELSCYKLAASPHLAAFQENKDINYNKILHQSTKILHQFPYVIIEGSGGVLVPIKEDFLLIDFIVLTQLPVVIIGRTDLGTLNHTLLTVEALKQKNITISYIFLNDYFKNEAEIINEDNCQVIEKLTKIKTLRFLSQDFFTNNIK